MKVSSILCNNLDLKLKISLTLVVLVLLTLMVFGSLAFVILAESDPGVLSKEVEAGALYGFCGIYPELLEISLDLYGRGFSEIVGRLPVEAEGGNRLGFF